MLKALGVLSLTGICVVAVIGLAGGGPSWFRYIGSSTVIVLLLAILSHVQDVVKALEGSSKKEKPEPFVEPPMLPADHVNPDNQWSDEWPN